MIAADGDEPVTDVEEQRAHKRPRKKYSFRHPRSEAVAVADDSANQMADDEAKVKDGEQAIEEQKRR
jgi:hypothetical protein